MTIELPVVARVLFPFSEFPEVVCLSQKVQPFCRIKIKIHEKDYIALVVDLENPNLEQLELIKRKKYQTQLIDKIPIFTEQQWSLAQSIVNEYRAKLGEVVTSMLPSGLRESSGKKISTKKKKMPTLNSFQQSAVKTILNNQTTLLFGITGSGKTRVYLELIKQVAAKNQSVILLLPEITLANHILQSILPFIEERPALLHSSLPKGEYLAEYRRILSGKAKVVIGTRSAIFAPVSNLGAIIIDEEHDPSYKEQFRFRYHARRVAAMRSKLNDIKLLLGSATPSAETWLAAQTGRIALAELPEKATGVHLPDVKSIIIGHNWVISPELKAAMRRHLQNGNQVLLFLNRRGHSTHVWDDGILNCPHCSIALTYHKPLPRSEAALKCHFCGYFRGYQNTDGSLLGSGTQKVEDILEEEFPGVSYARLDQDSSRIKDYANDILSAMKSGEIRILIGTQMIAKGLDFPNVSLVGILQADQGLSVPDFRASEKIFQLTMQVIGRSGRHQAGEVFIQTMNPDHSVIVRAINQDYVGFMRQELTWRKRGNYPPFVRLLRVVWSGESQMETQKVADTMVKNWLSPDLFAKAPNLDFSEEVLGPTTTPIEKTKSRFRVHLLIKLKSRLALEKWLDRVHADKAQNQKKEKIKMDIDLDPIELM